MKTIEKRAREYEKKYYNGAAPESYIAFIRGAQSEHEELTRWHVPKRDNTKRYDYPPDYKIILVKIENDDGSIKYAVGCCIYGRWCGDGIGYYDKVVGWREIHEDTKASNESK